MNSKHVDILKTFSKILKNEPDIQLLNAEEEPVIVIDKVLTIRDEWIEVASIKGKQRVMGFVLETGYHTPATREQPEDYDIAEIYQNINFIFVAVAAIQHLVTMRLDNVRETVDMDALVQELEEARKADNNAYNEGHLAYKRGDDSNANPYPFGISVYYKWRQGWMDAEQIECNKAYDEARKQNT